jgi:UDP-N-acetylglucosamine:LPS N-acetylglucosamine transferase
MAAPRRDPGPVLLVASTGGHLNQLWALRDGWPRDERVWVTYRKPDALALLADERVIYAHHPTHRNLANLLRNVVLALRVLRRERPVLLVTTGAAVAVPFAYAARLRRVGVIYVEGLGRVHDLSLSARLTAPVADRLFVQWPELVDVHAKAEYAGTLL